MWKYFTISQLHYCHRFSFMPYLYYMLLLVQYLGIFTPTMKLLSEKWRVAYTTDCKYVSWIRYIFGVASRMEATMHNIDNDALFPHHLVYPTSYSYTTISPLLPRSRFLSIAFGMLLYHRKLSWKCRKFCLLLHSIECKRCIKFIKSLARFKFGCITLAMSSVKEHKVQNNVTNKMGLWLNMREWNRP